MESPRAAASERPARRNASRRPVPAGLRPRRCGESGWSTCWTRTPCPAPQPFRPHAARSEEHTSELQSHVNLVCRLLLEKKNKSSTATSRCTTKSKVHFWMCMRGKTKARVDERQKMKALLLNNPRLPLSGFFFNDTATTEIYTLSLHDALPI